MVFYEELLHFQAYNNKFLLSPEHIYNQKGVIFNDHLCILQCRGHLPSFLDVLFGSAYIHPTTIRPRFSKNDPYSPSRQFNPVWVYSVDEYNCVSIKVFYVL